ncbi:MAG: transposase [Actinomycetota bacterium]|nr:transposase [Actinomycetota bacterium]
MREQLASEEGKAHYSQRMVTIEPIFGQTKHT